MNRKKTGTGPDCNRWQPDRRLRFIGSEDFTGCGSSKFGNIPTPGPATRTGINDDKCADTNSGPAIKTTINHDHFKSSTTPTATTPTPTTPTTRQWPRQDLRRPQRLRRHDDHREPATLDRHQREQPRQHQRLRPTTNDHHHSNINSRNDSDDTMTTATTTRATFGHNNNTLNNDDATTTATATHRRLQKQHVDNRDDDRDDDEKGEGGLALRDDGDSDGGSLARSCGYSSITILSLFGLWPVATDPGRAGLDRDNRSFENPATGWDRLLSARSGFGPRG
ncbi:hypothetical protein EDB85DRAFT_1886723 [Lactarius pseudohatsudake]|nr:hypothetical protein EDB85DRAFT_1886723 [Lactarius pseudohatsudake]